MFGADPSTLFSALTGNGKLPLKVWPLAGAMMLAALARTPLSMLERAYVKRKQFSLLDGDPKAPIFILGHWRSGTTHLYNILGKDPRFAYVSPFAVGMPWDFLLLGRWLNPLLRKALPADRYIDRVEVNPDSPQEDEIGLAAMQDLSYYFGIYFPEHFDRHYRDGVFFEELPKERLDHWKNIVRHFFTKLMLEQPNRQLLIKNPVYTGRAALLKEMWPQAKFIHIYRNPYVVFQSTRRFYRSLFPRLSLQPYDETQADRWVLETYPRMLEALKVDRENMPESDFVELKFEDLEADPHGQLAHIYEHLGIGGFERVKPIFEKYLASVSGYKKNRHGFPEDAIQLVDEHWGHFVRDWGYQPPE